MVSLYCIIRALMDREGNSFSDALFREIRLQWHIPNHGSSSLLQCGKPVRRREESCPSALPSEMTRIKKSESNLPIPQE